MAATSGENEFQLNGTNPVENIPSEIQILASPRNISVVQHFVDQNVVQDVGELDKEMFLQALRDYSCLWDTSNINYKNRTMKLNAWKSLSRMFQREGKCSKLMEDFKKLENFTCVVWLL